MSETRTTSDGADQGVVAAASDIWTMSVDYARQEIKDPLTDLGAYLKWGMAAAVAVGLGTILVALGTLRALQTEATSTFDGNWSWAPYVIAVVVAMLPTAVFAVVVTRKDS